MPLYIVRFELEEKPVWGSLENAQVFVLDVPCATTGELVRRPYAELAAAAARARDTAPYASSALKLLAPVTAPARVLCQGANYRQHMIDSGMDPDAKTFNMFFTKSSASIHTPHGEIARPPHVKLLDYEIELTLVLRARTRGAIRVSPDELGRYVAGVCIGNDVSARDVQIPQMQFHKGKSYRTFCPLGPVLCLLDHDELHYLDEMLLSLTVNGEQRQHDHSGNLVFRPAETLTEYSQVTDFDPGDVLMTGTPAGCALGLPPPVVVRLSALLPEAARWKAFASAQARRPYLQPGDVVESRIVSRDGRIDLGAQRHVVRAAAEPL